MKAKEYLSQAIWLDRKINNKLEQKERLESLTQKVTVDITQEKVSCTKMTSPMENAIVKLIDLSHEINDDIDKLVDLKKEILETINKVNDITCQVLLEMRYICGKSWEDVASAMGYDRSTIFRIHGKALKEVQKIKSCD
ncbi:MAG: hypothetical protein PWQ37_2488 [Candidatus Petromonas sp.]|jgi:DNA-directed RNA polymerase specialized sigma subunit|nr:hypothetical protein [Candidatus Petromonas sp.]